MAFVLTRPLGATVGDLFSKPLDTGGLGLGTVGTSAVLAAILVVLIAYTHLNRRRSDTEVAAAHDKVESSGGRTNDRPDQREGGRSRAAGTGAKRGNGAASQLPSPALRSTDGSPGLDGGFG